MATLQEISARLKSVKSISKITKSMKMVSAAKFARAEKALKDARAIGPTSAALSDKGGVTAPEDSESQIMICVSSDRGLCGGIHSGLCREARKRLAEKPSNVTTKLVAVGDKPRSILSRTHKSDLLVTASNVGKKPPSFADATAVAKEILASGFDYSSGEILYNHFKTAASYQVGTLPVLGASTMESSEELSAYEDVDDDAVKNYAEFNLANSLYYAMLEGAAAEQSARMSAMENATNNANDMIDALELKYNRTRQAVITTELIEIISGAAAME
jgi:F-type H+-transporting ATPase subunit gamma